MATGYRMSSATSTSTARAPAWAGLSRWKARRGGRCGDTTLSMKCMALTVTLTSTATRSRTASLAEELGYDVIMFCFMKYECVTSEIIGYYSLVSVGSC